MSGIVIALIGAVGLVVAAALPLLWRQNKKLNQINTAVNHRPEGAPTLVERVGIIEDATRIHREWELEAFSRIANQIGVKLPPHPKENP